MWHMYMRTWLDMCFGNSPNGRLLTGNGLWCNTRRCLTGHLLPDLEDVIFEEDHSECVHDGKITVDVYMMGRSQWMCT